MQGQDISQPKGRCRAPQLWTKTGRRRSVTRGDQATTLQTDRWIERTQQMNKGRQPANPTSKGSTNARSACPDSYETMPRERQGRQGRRGRRLVHLGKAAERNENGVSSECHRTHHIFSGDASS